MAIDSDLLLSPNGPIDPKLFPGEESNVLAARLERYVENAYDDERVAALTPDAVKDKGARALALSTAFNDVYIRMSAEPLTVSLGSEKGSHGYSAAQLQNIKAIADGYLAELEDLVPTTSDAVVAGTMGVRNTFVW